MAASISVRNKCESDEFESFVFDLRNQMIVGDTETRQLSPKAFAVLRHLYYRPDTLVTKAELLDAVWPDACVVEGVLKNVIREIRLVLNDDARAPRFVATVHRRGYRFVGAGHLSVTVSSDDSRECATPDPSAVPAARRLVGREQELGVLSSERERSHSGLCRAVTVSGPPGIGKSSLVEMWLAAVAASRESDLVTKVVCVQSSMEQPYMPFFDVLDQLCQGPLGGFTRELLAQQAPSWSAHMPWVDELGQLPGATGPALGLTRSQLFLEAASVLETLSKRRPLILLFEDIHWCDPATVDLLDFLRRRRFRPRLLIVTTRRCWGRRRRRETTNVDWRDARLADGWKEIGLGPLDEGSVRTYMATRSPPGVSLRILADRLYERSGGHPLYLEGAVDELDAGSKAKLIEVDAPKVFVQRLAKDLASMSAEERRLLQTASVVLTDAFSAAATAALLDQDVIETEHQYDHLAEKGLWIQRLDTRLWPDGTLAQAFGFLHPIYRDFLYQTLPVARRRRLHLIHALRLESAYRDQTTAIADNLSHHFGHGGERQRALHYRELAQGSATSTCARMVGDLTPRLHVIGPCRA